MKFEIRKKVFIKNLEKVLKIANNKNSLPTLTGILFNVENNKISLIGSNGNTSIKVLIEEKESLLKIHSKGKFLINGRYLTTILKKIDEPKILIESTEDKFLNIKTELFNSELSIMDYSEYPNIDFECDEEKSFKINSKILAKNINDTIFTINENDRRTILTGINIKKIKNKLYFTATDSYRLAYKSIEIENKINDFNKTIPFLFANVISKIIIDENINEDIKLYFNEQFILVKIKNNIIKSKTIFGNFPDARKIIPNDFKTNTVIETRTLKKIIDRVTSISQSNLDENLVKIKIKKNKILFSSSISEIVNCEEILNNFEFIGNNQEITINGKYFFDAIKIFNENKIKINFIDEIKPIVINPLNNNDFIQLILPVRMY